MSRNTPFYVKSVKLILFFDLVYREVLRLYKMNTHSTVFPSENENKLLVILSLKWFLKTISHKS